MESVELTSTLDIILEHNRDPASLINILNEIQEEQGFLPMPSLELLAKELKISLSKIHGVITFYSQYKLNKPGKYEIRVCNGTACFVKDSRILIDTLKSDFNIVSDTTTEDGVFSMETVSCLGCCALAPVVEINGEIHGEMNSSKLKRLIKGIKRKEVIQ